MRYIGFILLLLIGCHNIKPKDNNETNSIRNAGAFSTDSLELKQGDEFWDNRYVCECEKFISNLEEIPDTDSNAYRITIKSKEGNWVKSSLIDTRPQLSRISYCTDLYTVVGFPAGGPCYSDVFVFTIEDRPNEQYDNVQSVKNSQNLITHIRNEEFEKLILHNFENNKEIAVDISNSELYNYGVMDSIIMKKDNIVLYYYTQNEKFILKK